MFQPNPTEQELLKTILEPLLNDFQYWFSRAETLLETERLSFLSQEEQADLLNRFKNSQKEVASAQILFQATGGQAGIDTAVLAPWHQLVAEYWQISLAWRKLNQQDD